MDNLKTVGPCELGRILRASVPAVMIAWVAGCATGGSLNYGGLSQSDHQALVNQVMSFPAGSPPDESALSAFFENLDSIFEQDYGPTPEEVAIPPAPGGGEALGVGGPAFLAAQQASANARHNACDVDYVMVVQGPTYSTDPTDLIYGPWGEICTRRGSHRLKPSPNYHHAATVMIRPNGILGTDTYIPYLGLDVGKNEILVQCPDDFTQPCMTAVMNRARPGGRPVRIDILTYRHRPDKEDGDSHTYYSAAAWIYLSAAAACFTCQKKGWCSTDR